MARPTLRRRRLAHAIKRLREQAGMELKDAAQLAGFSPAKLSRIEKAEIAISGDDTHEICKVLGVDKTAAEELVELARHAKRRGWWQAYPDSVLGRTTDLLELEADADVEKIFTIDVVPGLVQTEDYARTVIRRGFQRECAESIQQRVEMRMARQQRLIDGDLELWAIIDESALRRPIGGSEATARQVDYLASVADGQHVHIQVLPCHVDGHPALGTPFSMFTLDDGYTCVALDNLTGGLYVEDETEVRAYSDTWSKLAAVAVSFAQSAELLSTIADDHRSNT